MGAGLIGVGLEELQVQSLRRVANGAKVGTH